jgi:hypothetical protein
MIMSNENNPASIGNSYPDQPLPPSPAMIGTKSMPIAGGGQLASARKAVMPFTVSEGFLNLEERLDGIKADLDRLIADATTLRAQL